MLYGLAEVEGGYSERTRRNVLDSDGTFVALAEDPESPEPEAVASWIRREGARFLKVAGPRGSKAPRSEGFVSSHLQAAIGVIRGR